MFYEVGDYYNYNYDDDVGKLWHRKSKLLEEDQIASSELWSRSQKISWLTFSIQIYKKLESIKARLILSK